MRHQHRVLIAYDGSANAALAITAVARLIPQARVLVIHTCDEPFSAERASLARAALPGSVIATAAQRLEQLAAEAAQTLADRGAALARQAGLDAQSLVRAAPAPWRGIRAAAEEHEADLVVCGTRGQGGFSRAVLGSTSSALIHHAQMPVLVVPHEWRTPDGPTVIGYDGSDDARRAVAATARLLPGRAALVVHAWSSAVQRSLLGGSLLSAPLAEVREIARDLDEVFAGHARDCAAEGAALAREHGLATRALDVEAAPGAWRALAAAAEKEAAALIVAGRRGRGPVIATLLGSVSAGLTHNAERPVLVVPGARERADGS